MTREEAITSYEKWLYAYMVGDDDAIDMDYGEFMELNHYIRTALRPITREQVEKMWRGEWIEYEHPHIICCTRCDYGTWPKEKTRFCPYCGAPMTDEAVEMVMERINKMEETKK